MLAPFLGGLVAMALRLPPLVGFLAAGFTLKAMDYESIPALEVVADLGVTLLLFTIGLKLNIRTLLRREVWGTASLHMITSAVTFAALLAVLKILGIALLQTANLQTFAVLAFALSFSSTVFAVKILEERNESRSLYGRTAIGILIMQDIFAVVFLTASTGELPSAWALGLVLLIPAAPVLRGILARLGRGEMQILYGVVLALVLGYALFEQVGIKGDLGALIAGMLLASHPAANELSKALFNIKELFLVGFFVSIGLTALPTWESVALAAILVALVPLKSIVFLFLLSGFRLRYRTSLLATLSLSNYSEFGLIVAVLAAGLGWMDDEWLVVLSLTVALSFVVAALLNARSASLHRRTDGLLPERDPANLHPSDQPIVLGDARTVILGMGRVGQGAYDRLTDQHGMAVLGIDTDPAKISDLRSRGYSVIEGDATDADFWEKLLLSGRVELVLLAMPHHAGNVFALDQLRHREFPGIIAAIVTRAEEIDRLSEQGAHAVFNLYEEAGLALADSAIEIVRHGPQR
nr:cation:proton antiporter family protein [Phytoactinopolyspora alkaliphila]